LIDIDIFIRIILFYFGYLSDILLSIQYFMRLASTFLIKEGEHWFYSVFSLIKGWFSLQTKVLGNPYR